MVKGSYFVYKVFHIFHMPNITLIHLNRVWQIFLHRGLNLTEVLTMPLKMGEGGGRELTKKGCKKYRQGVCDPQQNDMYPFQVLKS